jgi:hypothetical protein
MPDKAYLFPSKEKPGVKSSTEGNAKQVKRILTKKYPSLECEILPLNIDRANDIQEIYENFKENVSKALRDLKRLNGYNFCLNVSSGTQQMTQAAQLYLFSSQINTQIRYYQCSAPGFVTKLEDRVREVSAAPLEETALLEQIKDNGKKFQFHSLVKDCRRLSEVSRLKGRQNMAKILSATFSAYENMEQMNYRAAYAVMQEVSGFGIPHLTEIVDAQKAFLEHVKEEKEEENTHNLTDLYHNMCRAFNRGNYADVLARFWRLKEGMLYYRLETLYGVNVRHVEKSKNKDNVQKLKNNGGFCNHIPTKGSFKKTNLELFADILVFLGDKTLEESEKRYKWRNIDGAMEQVREARNHTYIAHGMKPARKEDAQTCLDLAKEILPLISNGAGIQENYPFTEKNMYRLIDLLIRV